MFTDEEEKARRKRLGNHAPVLSGGKVQHTGPAASGPAAPGASTSGASTSGASTSGASTSGLSGTAAGRPVRGGAASASPGRAIPAPKPAAGRATRTPAPVIAAVERGDKLGAEPMSPMDVALGLTKNKLDLARTGKGRLGETFRKRFEEEGYRFGRGGKIMEDAPGPGAPRLDLTPGRGESGKTASGEEALAAIRRLGESPRGTEASLGKFKRGLSDRLPELTDEELPEAEKTLAEARARLTGSAKQTQDGLTRAAASASADTLDQATKALKQESKLRQTTKPSDGEAEQPEAEQPEAAKPGAQSPDGDSGAPKKPRIQLAQAPGSTATDATPDLIPASEGDGSNTGGVDGVDGEKEESVEKSPTRNPHPEAAGRASGEAQSAAPETHQPAPTPPLPPEKPDDLEERSLRAEQRDLLEKHASDEGLSDAERERAFIEIPLLLSERLQERFRNQDPAVLEAIEDAGIKDNVNEGFSAASTRDWENVTSTAFVPETEFDTEGSVRVDIVNPGIHLDGLNYTIRWEPLDENGRVMPQISEPESVVEEKGGHAIPFLPTTQVLEPPFDNPHGWTVQIVVPPQATKGGNSAQPYLNIYKER